MGRIAIGSDDAGFPLKTVLQAHLAAKGVATDDLSPLQPDPAVTYPEVAEAVALAVAAGTYERGIIICGTGIGVCITANKVPGIRAALCHDVYSAERARKSNDAQVITMGARVVGPELAKSIIDAWLLSDFGGGGSTPKVEKMNEIDMKYRKDA